MLLLGGKAIRELLADVRWRWSSDAKDAEQRRCHEEDRHRLEIERGWLELKREFPDSTSSAIREIGPGRTPRELMPPNFETPPDEA
jgi:hypothetical protein